MTTNGINNQTFSFLDSITSNSKPKDLVEKPLLEKQSQQDFEKVADKTFEPQVNDKTSTRDTVRIYQAAQKAINKLKDDGNEIDIKEEDVEDCKDVYFLVFNTAQTQIENRIDGLTKEIAYLDLNSANGVEDILTKANLIEGLRGLEQGVQEGLKQLTALTTPEELEPCAIDAGLIQDLKFQVDNFIQEAQDHALANNGTELQLAQDLKASDSQNLNYQDLSLLNDLQHLTVQEYNESSEDSDATDSSLTELSDILSPDTKAEEKLSSKEPEILAGDNPTHNHDPAHHGHQEFGSGLYNPTQVNLASVDKSSIKFETVNIKDLSNYLESQVRDIPQNKTQEIRLQITPDSIGKVDLVITKNEHNEISVQMSFHSKEGLDNIKQDLKNTIAELREVLKSKDLDLSKFEVKESNASRTAYDGGASTGSFNQAREEQKSKLQNTIPEWVKLKESSTQVSFKQVIEGI